MTCGIASRLAVASSLPSLASKLAVASSLPSVASELQLASCLLPRNSYESVNVPLGDEDARRQVTQEDEPLRRWCDPCCPPWVWTAGRNRVADKAWLRLPA